MSMYDKGVINRQPYGRGLGHDTQQECQSSSDHGASNGCEQSGILWYPKCDNKYHPQGCCICSPDTSQNDRESSKYHRTKSPTYYDKSSGSIPKGPSYGRGMGHTTQQECQSSSDHGASNGCEQSGILWYPKCDNKYHPQGCCICSPNCPQGYTDDGSTCIPGPSLNDREYRKNNYKRNSYNRSGSSPRYNK